MAVPSLKRWLVLQSVLLGVVATLLLGAITPLGPRFVLSWIALPFQYDSIEGNFFNGMVIHNAHQGDLWRVERVSVAVAWGPTLQGTPTLLRAELQGIHVHTDEAWWHNTLNTSQAPSSSMPAWTIEQLHLQHAAWHFSPQLSAHLIEGAWPMRFDGQHFHVGPGHLRGPTWSMELFPDHALLHHDHAGQAALRWVRDDNNTLNVSANSTAWWGQPFTFTHTQTPNTWETAFQQNNNHLTARHTPEGTTFNTECNKLNDLWPSWQGRLISQGTWNTDTQNLHLHADALDLWPEWGGLRALELTLSHNEGFDVLWDAHWGPYHTRGKAQEQADTQEWVVEEATLTHLTDNTFTLQAPTRIHLAQRSITPHCWRNPSGDGLCLQHHTDGWLVDAQAFPLQVSGVWQNTTWHTEGLLHGQLSQNNTDEHGAVFKEPQLVGRLDWHHNNTLLVHPQGQSQWRDQHLWFEAAPTQWQAGFQAARHTPQPDLLWQRDLNRNTHSVMWQALDLSTLNLETPWTQAADGITQGTLSGPWPQVPEEGELQLRQASWHWRQANTDTLIHQADLSLSGTQRHGAAQGVWGGPFEAELQLRHTPQGWRGPITFSGEQLTPVHNDQYHVRLDAHGALQWNQEPLALEAHIHEAVVHPRALTPVLRLSPDVRFTNNTLHTTPEAKPHWPFTCTLFLGNQVHVKAHGLNSQLSGHLALDGRQPDALLAKGSVLLRDGSYHAYGQDFVLEQGRLSFEGGPIDTPLVRLRATRTLAATDEHEGLMAGLDVSGWLNEPTVALFSEPEMPDHDIVSYLLWDQPSQGMERNQSQALLALTQGWLADLGQERLPQGFSFALQSPTQDNEGPELQDFSMIFKQQWSDRLYISYQMGLMNASRSVHFDYWLNRHLRVSAQSNLEHTGGDVSWRFAVGSRPQVE